MVWARVHLIMLYTYMWYKESKRWSEQLWLRIIFRCVMHVRKEERIRSLPCFGLRSQGMRWPGFDSCSSFRAGWGLWMVPQMTPWIDVRPGLWFGKPSTLVPSAGATLAQETMRQEDPYETSLPQSKFKATASLCVGLETAKTSVQINGREKKLHIRRVILPCVPCSVVAPKLSSAWLQKTRRVRWCDGNSISLNPKCQEAQQCDPEQPSPTVSSHALTCSV